MDTIKLNVLQRQQDGCSSGSKHFLERENRSVQPSLCGGRQSVI